jgi:protein-disulfide isomerase
VSGDVSKELVFIGCYSCKYTHATYPLIKDLIKQYKPTVRYVFYPAHREADYLMSYDYCVQTISPDKYLSWIDSLYTESLDVVASESSTIQLIKSLGIDDKTIAQCTSSSETKQIVQKRIYEIDKTGIYGTPTIFLNGTPVVGPKPYRVYRRLLNNSWF